MVVGIKRNSLYSKCHRKSKRINTKYLSLNILVDGKLSCIKTTMLKKKRYAVMQWFICIKKH